MKNPSPIGDATTRADAFTLADEATSWAYNEGEDPAEYGYKIGPMRDPVNALRPRARRTARARR